MKEEFLHYLWQYQLFSLVDLQTTNNKQITIVKQGILNTNSGPDFLQAKIKMNHQLWAGNVEIHLKSSDWYAHQHETDVNYDAVILHVVWEDDATVFMKNNRPLPTLVLKNLVDKSVLKNYQQLFSSQKKFIPCENLIENVHPFVFQNWNERLYFERLEYKTAFIKQLLQKSNHDFEAVLFHLLAKNFGLKVNADAFLQMATSFNFSILRKERFNKEKLSALLFGQSGFLEDEQQELYAQALKKEYDFLKNKYQIQPISKHQFQFFRMRPANFPTIRIAQLVSIFYTHQNLFSQLMSINKLADFYELLSVAVDVFWQTHYTFEKTSKKSSKKLTKSFIDLLIINTIMPLKFYYLQQRGEVAHENIIALMQQIKPEKNSVISRFSDIKITSKNAFETQALLQLRNEYCTTKRCLQCAIGNDLLRKN